MDLEELSKIVATTTHNLKLNKTDDYFLFQFIGSILDLVDFKDKCCLTDNGRNMLLYSGFNKALKEGNKTDEQKKEAFKATLYLFIGFTLSVLFVGFMGTKEIEENKALWEHIPNDVLELMDEVKELLKHKLPVYKGLLEHLTKCLDEEYAVIFNREKRAVFNRDIFNEPVITLGDEEGIDVIKKSAVEVK
jgi:hypothetical protein